MLQDLRFAFRLFARQRRFFVTAVLTIALGVGLSATVFAVVDGVLFRPLPYSRPLPPGGDVRGSPGGAAVDDVGVVAGHGRLAVRSACFHPH